MNTIQVKIAILESGLKHPQNENVHNLDSKINTLKSLGKSNKCCFFLK